eukprot:3496326-Rhodomonas_salina.6
MSGTGIDDLLSSTVMAYACYAMCGTALAYDPTLFLRHTLVAPTIQYQDTVEVGGCCIGLSASYAMSGTDLAWAATGLHACYAVSGTGAA